MAMFCTMMNLLHQQFPLDQATRTLTEPVVDRLVEDRLVDDRLVVTVIADLLIFSLLSSSVSC